MTNMFNPETGHVTDEALKAFAEKMLTMKEADALTLHVNSCGECAKRGIVFLRQSDPELDRSYRQMERTQRLLQTLRRIRPGRSRGEQDELEGVFGDVGLSGLAELFGSSSPFGGSLLEIVLGTSRGRPELPKRESLLEPWPETLDVESVISAEERGAHVKNCPDCQEGLLAVWKLADDEIKAAWDADPEKFKNNIKHHAYAQKVLQIAGVLDADGKVIEKSAEASAEAPKPATEPDAAPVAEQTPPPDVAAPPVPAEGEANSTAA